MRSSDSTRNEHARLSGQREHSQGTVGTTRELVAATALASGCRPTLCRQPDRGRGRLSSAMNPAVTPTLWLLMLGVRINGDEKWDCEPNCPSLL
jgi:hypothetical protein